MLGTQASAGASLRAMGVTSGRLAFSCAVAVAAVASLVMPAAESDAAPGLPTAERYPLVNAGFDGLAGRGADGSGVVVAVVDTGVDLTHPAFAGRLLAGWDFVDGDANPRDENGHGTHVAGIVAASADSSTPGGAPAATLLPVRVLDADGSGDNSTVAQGITWAAEQGADVINLSIGDSGIGSRLRKGGPEALAIRAASRTAVVVVAAGNEGQFERLFRPGVPGLVVVASDRSDQPAPFTNVGDPRAVAAPGVDIISTVPRYPTTMFPNGSAGYATMSGTSMAAPLVSAEAALLVQAGASTPTEIASAVTSTAANPNQDPRLGAGVVDAGAALGQVTGDQTSPGAASQAPPTPEPSSPPEPQTPADPATGTESATAAEDTSPSWLPVVAIAVTGLIAVGLMVAWATSRGRSGGGRPQRQ